MAPAVWVPLGLTPFRRSAQTTTRRRPVADDDDHSKPPIFKVVSENPNARWFP